MFVNLKMVQLLVNRSISFVEGQQIFEIQNYISTVVIN